MLSDPGPDRPYAGKPDNEKNMTDTTSSPTSHPESKRYSGFRLLIVDDNRNNLFTLRTLIQKHMDVEILEALSGKQALSIALQEPNIDVIVLDVQMPEMDGFQTASMLKIRKKTRDIPIIFLTAAFKTGDFQKKGYEVGAVDYLLKPIDDDLLTNKISTYFRLIQKEREMNRVLEEQVLLRTAELQSANRYREQIIDTMGEALLILNPNGAIKSANAAAYRMLDFPEGDLVGTLIGDVFEEEDQAEANAFMGTWLEALIRVGVIRNIEARFITKEGQRIPILFSRSAIKNEEGNITDIICIARDITGYQRVIPNEGEPMRESM
uniref:PAS domain S-box-containing protein n=2 Tax=unclassified Candidatus Kentrum TaxID=2643149 RepID=A0A451B4Q3_9GAMM|nr:MAG: PAS domain S-box-containing protein [Candidatus Kentron sp. LPFa]VFK18577.1 MAG: PAS domain S-box-containing protein [Candidatus Kentron sp. LPFa]VFK29284.1 MAG: PAS domain S-box-containing protein [Candidatus Kentron sp. LPFa]VFK67993.1 MAG: PAS domain S-box-containing protein [Candidatus Kentron sp. UNK]VFK73261.1 MAG: PAS domain S-box-containing protein [Candidatus Kentron sp. UNK]